MDCFWNLSIFISGNVDFRGPESANRVKTEISRMIENEASVKGRVIAELLSHLTNDLQIGKKIKSGEL